MLLFICRGIPIRLKMTYLYIVPLPITHKYRSVRVLCTRLSFCITCEAGNDQEAKFFIYKNGTITTSGTYAFLRAGRQISVYYSTVVSLVTNDYVQIGFMKLVGSGTLTIVPSASTILMTRVRG